VIADYDIPCPTILPPQAYAQARAQLVGQAITAAVHTANQSDQSFLKALNDVNFGQGVTNPQTGEPSSGADSLLDPSIAADDPLSPGENSQGGYNDCWLVSIINAMMETLDGQQQLRDGVRWDPSIPGYLVRVFDKGKEIWVPVSGTLSDGSTIIAGSSSGPGIVSLYEVAVSQHFGSDYLNSAHSGGDAAVIMENQKTELAWGFKFGPIQVGTADNAIASSGSVDGSLSIGCTPKKYPGGNSTLSVSATPSPGSGASSQSVQIWANHVYEVVDVKNGMIGLRNPWGLGNPADGNAQNAAGVFYINQKDFNDAFPWLTTAEK